MLVLGPFGGVVSNNNEKNFPQTYRTKESADLFLILMIHLLKTGDRAAIVLPDGSLTGDGVKQRIRQKLLEDCNLHTIIRLPNSVFQPYASVATNLLFFIRAKQQKMSGTGNINYQKDTRPIPRPNPFNQPSLTASNSGGISGKKTSRHGRWILKPSRPTAATLT